MKMFEGRKRGFKSRISQKMKFAIFKNRQVVSETNFSKCGLFCGIRSHYAYQYLQAQSELILPCCKNGNAIIRSQSGVKGHRVHFIVVGLKGNSRINVNCASSAANRCFFIRRHA